MIYVIAFLISLQFQGKDHSFQNDNYSCLSFVSNCLIYMCGRRINWQNKIENRSVQGEEYNK